MSDADAALVYVLFGSADQARSVARTVIGERLAACANIMAPCTSLYEWHGLLEETTEVPALFKTAPDRRDALMTRIAELHDYDVPAILHWPSDKAHGAYSDWLKAQTEER